jgi:hypothetical protein
MDGRPVWLASMSRRAGNGKIIPALKWPSGQLKRAQARLHQVLHGVGDPNRERCFMMCITLCMHRALSDADIAALPPKWHDAPALDVAGGPIKILYARGCSESPSTLPCEHYDRVEIPDRDFEGDRLWIPEECGECPPCRARALATERAACSA